MSIYYKFATRFICLTKFLHEMFSSSVSIGNPVLAGHTSQPDGLTAAEGRVGSSRMPHVGYADPVMNYGPRFCLNISGKNSPNLSLVPSR